MRLELPDPPPRPCVCKRSPAEIAVARFLSIEWTLFFLIILVEIFWRQLPFSWQAPLWFGQGGIVLLIAVVQFLIYLRARRAMRDGGVLLCPDCRHPVDSDGDHFVRCAQCGARHDAELVRRGWEGRYRVRLDHLRAADAAPRAAI